MVAFVTTVVISVILLAVPFAYGTVRDPDRALTWGEAMMASVYLFLTMFWVYGIVPHQWIVWADSDLGWRQDKFLGGPAGVLENLPFDITYSALRDIVVVVIYTVYVAIHIWGWAWWQNRGKAAPAEAPVSDYGRPLRREVVRT